MIAGGEFLPTMQIGTTIQDNVIYDNWAQNPLRR
jgi:hypothetical protein